MLVSMLTTTRTNRPVHKIFSQGLSSSTLAEELVMLMEGNGMELDRIQGMNFNPFRQTWSMTSDLAVNYIAAFRHKI